MKTWQTLDGPVSEAEVESVMALISDGRDSLSRLAWILGWKRNDRRIDRALQLLAKAGRIKFDHHGRKWSVVSEVKG